MSYRFKEKGESSKSHFKVHRLVAKAFIPNIKNLSTVNHIDGIGTNNHVSNLEWMSLGDNVRDAISRGTHHCMSERNKKQLKNMTQINADKSKKEWKAKIGTNYGGATLKELTFSDDIIKGPPTSGVVECNGCGKESR